MQATQFDIIIVGAGALGTFHAYQALKMGKKVLILEKDKRAQEATVRNFGQVVPSGLPPESEWHQYGRDATSIYKEIQEHYDISVRHNGSCYIASTQDEMAVLEELQAKFAAIDYEGQLLTKDAVLEKYPALKKDYAVGALCFAQEISVEPELMIHRTMAYLEAAYPSHFQYRNLCAVIDVSVSNGQSKLVTATKETFIAEHCFICSGRDFKLLFPERFLQSGLVVSKLNMMATAPLPSVQLPGNILTGLSIRRYESFVSCDAYQQLDTTVVPQDCKDYGIHILFKQRVDGSIIIGDSHEYTAIGDQDDLSIFRNDMNISGIILREARRIVHLPDWTIAQNWTGFYAQHPDLEIFRETIDERIHIVTGIGGKGMTTGAGFSANNMLKTLQG